MLVKRRRCTRQQLREHATIAAHFSPASTLLQTSGNGATERLAVRWSTPHCESARSFRPAMSRHSCFPIGSTIHHHADHMHRALCFIALISTFTLTAELRAQRVDTTFVEVHGHRIALYVSGSGPTVVMEAGGGSWSRDWVAVAPELSKEMRVVTYDRPGYGLSAPCPLSRTAERISDELHTALGEARIAGPFVLVGWSLGGAFVRVYADRYPKNLRGLVFVDPAVESFYRSVAAELPDDWSRETLGHFSTVYGDTTQRANQQELAAYESSMLQTSQADARSRTPAVLLIAGRDEDLATDGISRVWVRELRRWASSRSHVTARVVPNSGHHIPRQHPSAVIDAVRDMVKRSH